MKKEDRKSQNKREKKKKILVSILLFWILVCLKSRKINDNRRKIYKENNQNLAFSKETKRIEERETQKEHQTHTDFLFFRLHHFSITKTRKTSNDIQSEKQKEREERERFFFF